MTTSYWQQNKISNSTSEQRSYDTIIIGAGFAGLSAAYWLQKENPKIKIGILEKEFIGSGASGRNAGFVTCGSTEHFIKLNDQFGLEKAVEIWKFSETNRELLVEHIIEDQSAAVDYVNTGSCTVAPSHEHWLKYKEISQTMQKAGIDVYQVGEAEMQSDFGITGFEGGIQYRGDGFIHPIKLLGQLRRKLDCDIHEQTEVLSISKKDQTQVIQTTRGTFECGKLIVTVNAYLPLLMPNFSKIIQPGRGQILLTKALPHFVKGPCYLVKHLCYFRQLPTGQLLVGGFRNLALDKENTYADAVTPVIQEALFNFVKSHFKFGPQIEIENQWSGTMGFSPDGQMLIGPLAANKDIHIMTGCSGHGLGLSFNAARTLVGEILGREIPEHLKLSRFGV